MLLPEAVDGYVDYGHHQDKRQKDNIECQSEGMVERKAHASAIVPDREAHILREILQVVEKYLLPPHAHRVAEHVLGVDERHHRYSQGDEVVDEHQKDGQTSFAEPFGSFTST